MTITGYGYAIEVPRCVMALWTEEQVLPGQGAFDTKSFQLTPEQRIRLAVLEDAIICYLSSDRGKAKDAEKWIFSAQQDWSYSFEPLCDSLGVVPDRVRKRVLELKANGVQMKKQRTVRRAANRMLVYTEPVLRSKIPTINMYGEADQ